jgi:hypothetical protein
LVVKLLFVWVDDIGSCEIEQWDLSLDSAVMPHIANLYFPFFIGGEMVSHGGQYILVFHIVNCYIDSDIGLGLSILPQDIDEMVLSFLSQIELTHVS